MARGSLFKLETQLIIVNAILGINVINFDSIFQKLQNVKMLVNGFINHYKQKF